ncbi:MAG TPA: hypothetical protein VK489_01995 [Ferruginibacter sp.]|nr:hypothetical protein [Ferruginibacter sp.]
MKILFVTLMLSFFSVNLFAQLTKGEAFAELNILMQKSKDIDYYDFMLKKRTIVQQDFSEDRIAIKEKSKLGGENQYWITRYADIPWIQLESYKIVSTDGDKENILILNFKKAVKKEYFTYDKPGDEKPGTTKIIELYIWKKYKPDIEKYINRLYLLMQEAYKANPPKEAIEEQAAAQLLQLITDAQLKTLVTYYPKPAVISFWMNGCGPCFKLLAQIKGLHDLYKDKIDFYFISVSDDSRIKNVHALNTSYKIDYEAKFFYRMEKTWNTDLLKAMHAEWNAQYVPFTMLVNYNKKTAVNSVEQLTKAIADALK